MNRFNYLKEDGSQPLTWEEVNAHPELYLTSEAQVQKPAAPSPPPPPPSIETDPAYRKAEDEMYGIPDTWNDPFETAGSKLKPETAPHMLGMAAAAAGGVGLAPALGTLTSGITASGLAAGINTLAVPAVFLRNDINSAYDKYIMNQVRDPNTEYTDIIPGATQTATAKNQQPIYAPAGKLLGYLPGPPDPTAGPRTETNQIPVKNSTGTYIIGFEDDLSAYKRAQADPKQKEIKDYIERQKKLAEPPSIGNQISAFATAHPDATKYAGYGAAALGVAGLAYGGYKLIKDVYSKYNWKHSGCNSIEDVSSRTKCQLYLYDSKIADLKHSIKQCKDETCIKQIQDEITKNLEFKDKLSVGE